SDHGEEFLDHGSIGHGHSLYEELTHVPLVAVVPVEPGDRQCHEPVSMVDLPTTMLRVAGVSESFTDRNLFDRNGGMSPVVSELSIRSRYLQTIQKGHWKLLRKFKFLAPDSSPGLRFDFRCDSIVEKTNELFDLDSDPHEQVNLFEDPASIPVVANLESALDDWGDTHRLHSDQDSETAVDDIVVARLRDLGYLE
ncbi:MAG: hypothetical protein AABZ47_03375, partial [Planctomycetota bacterium]